MRDELETDLSGRDCAQHQQVHLLRAVVCAEPDYRLRERRYCAALPRVAAPDMWFLGVAWRGWWFSL